MYNYLNETNIEYLLKLDIQCVFKIIKTDIILLANSISSKYGMVLVYCILYKRSYKIRRRIVFEILDLKIEEPVDKENLLTLEGNYLNRRVV